MEIRIGNDARRFFMPALGGYLCQREARERDSSLPDLTSIIPEVSK